MSTLRGYWVATHGSSAVTRTSRRVVHACSNCGASIEIGAPYFDTGETLDRWHTLKLCISCADKPLNESRAIHAAWRERLRKESDGREK